MCKKILTRTLQEQELKCTLNLLLTPKIVTSDVVLHLIARAKTSSEHD
jgi:hypothetical protein